MSLIHSIHAQLKKPSISIFDNKILLFTSERFLVFLTEGIVRCSSRQINLFIVFNMFFYDLSYTSILFRPLPPLTLLHYYNESSGVNSMNLVFFLFQKLK